MINVGLDLGTTNSIISVYKDGKVEAVTLSGEKAIIPSVVAYHILSKQYYYGTAAKNKAGRENFIVYRAFKMLLGRNQEAEELQYDKERTPEFIAEQFIRDILGRTLYEQEEDRIGKLTVGIPEIWRKENAEAIDILRNLCKKLEFVDSVQIVTEPEAASAYYAYEYMRKNEENFAGHILIIDYGGGTLDITLSEIETLENMDSQYNMHIKTDWRTGVGDSRDGKIGKAAVVYQEELLREALIQAGILKKNQKISSSEITYGEYCERLNDIEEMLINSVIAINKNMNVYKEIGIWNAVKKLNSKEFATLYMKDGTEIPISYGMLVSVYQNVIKETLETEIHKMEEHMREKGIVYDHGNTSDFQWALVGGFGSFYLVDYQVKGYFQPASIYDKVIAGAENREKAISFGAALYANNIIGLKYTAPCSIGIWSRDSDKNIQKNFAFHYLDELEINKVYLVEKEDGNPAIFFSADGSVDSLVLKDNQNQEGYEYKLPQIYKEQIGSVVKFGFYYNVGFSMDSDEIITMWIYEYDRKNKKRAEFGKSITLNTLQELLSINQVKQS